MDRLNTNLWSANKPSCFWLCQDDFPEEIWRGAYIKAFPLLGLTEDVCEIESILALTLGEGRFGLNHWRLNIPKRIYYLIKPIIPRPFTRKMRRLYNEGFRTRTGWPVEERYVNFLWETMRQALILAGKERISINGLWPEGYRYAFVLTHDIETSDGQNFAGKVADLEEGLGFRSSFNFVPERYKVDHGLMEELKKRGFEVGVHGLHHDGKLFRSQPLFMKRAKLINHYLTEWEATGFRADLTHRQPVWMQALEIEYDLSFFDTDPFEPIPGGTMSIWPFFIGHFVELPYTLVQDYTLTSILGEKGPRIWLEKVDFIEKYHGMALVNSHPDYLRDKCVWGVYNGFLNAIKARSSYWHALPGEVASWWKARITSPRNNLPGLAPGYISLDGESIRIE